MARQSAWLHSFGEMVKLTSRKLAETERLALGICGNCFPLGRALGESMALDARADMAREDRLSKQANGLGSIQGAEGEGGTWGLGWGS